MANATLQQIDHVQGKQSKQSKRANQSLANVCANKTFKVKKKKSLSCANGTIKSQKVNSSYVNRTNYDNKSILKR